MPSDKTRRFAITAGAFSQDIVKSSESHIWEFVISSNHATKHVTLSWDTDQFSNAKNQLLLYDVIHDVIISIEDNSHYDMFIDQPMTFKAIYGDDTFIQETLKNIRIEMLQPYPNPFTHDIGLPMHLPYSTEPYAIDCNIYNVMGEKVFEQKLTDILPGLIEIKWSEKQTKNLKQGIYIYSIQVKNGFLTSDFKGRIVKN